jgi:long-chain fatty acid transport protein
MKKIVTLLTICAPLLSQAQGFQVSLQGQKQQAMAGTGTAHIQDGAALFFNPGGVAFLKSNSVSAGVSPVVSNGSYVDASSSAVYNTNSPVGYPFTGYLVLGKKESKLKYGLAVYTPFGSTIDWQPGWTGRFITTHLQLSTVFIQPTASYKINEKLGIGAGFVYALGKVNLRRDLPVADEDGNYGKTELSGKTQGIGFNAGVYFKPSDKLAFGLSYRSGVNMNVDKGQASFDVPASLSASFPTGNFSTELPLPKIISLGVAYSPCKNFTATFDGNFVGWKSFDSLGFDFEKNTSELPDVKYARAYKNVFSYRLGVQYSVNEKFDTRAGIKYLKSPVTDGYVSPEVPDASHFNYSFGAGYKFSQRFSADMSVTIQHMKREDSNLEMQMTGTYYTSLFIPGVSFNYNF